MNGQQVWRFDPEGIAYGPVHADGDISLYFEVLASESGEGSSMFMRAMDMTTRQVLWSANDAASGPTLMDGIVRTISASATICEQMNNRNTVTVWFSEILE